jgi:copper(I)-binding protein
MGDSSHVHDRGMSHYRACSRAALRLAPLAWLIAAGAAQANDIAVSGAWTPPNAEIGSDTVLGMVVTNDGADADALVRVSCPVANFSEKRQIDIGEGASRRERSTTFQSPRKPKWS